MSAFLLLLSFVLPPLVVAQAIWVCTSKQPQARRYALWCLGVTATAATTFLISNVLSISAALIAAAVLGARTASKRRNDRPLPFVRSPLAWTGIALWSYSASCWLTEEGTTMSFLPLMLNGGFGLFLIWLDAALRDAIRTTRVLLMTQLGLSAGAWVALAWVYWR